MTLEMHIDGDEKYVSPASESIEIRLLSFPSDIDDDDKAFNPEYTHQLFGENESIFGYEEPTVHLFYGAASLLTHMSFECKSKAPADQRAKADNALEIIGKYLPQGYISNLDVFLSKLNAEEAKFKPMGVLVHSYTDPEDANTTYGVYKCTNETPGFCEYFARAQLFSMWTIETANPIDLDDPEWRVYLSFRHTRNPSDAAKSRHALVGYSTVYQCFSYPNKVRLRVAQHVVLPPYQRAGHGTELLRGVMMDARKSPEVFDVTVEDPNEFFTIVRDTLDTSELMRLPSFNPLPEAWNDSLATVARETLKITKPQARRVYEILRLAATNVANADEYKAYRLQIKKRIYRDISAERIEDPAERLKAIDELYKADEQCYRHVIARIKAR